MIKLGDTVHVALHYPVILNVVKVQHGVENGLHVL